MVKPLVKLVTEEINPFYQRNERFKAEKPNYYGPTDPELYDKEENVFEANAYELGNNLGEGTTFGLTQIYGGRIILLDSLKGEDRKKVLEHEKFHRKNPAASEAMTRQRTYTESFSPNPVVSPVGGY